jgi:hypothetical protein
MADRVGTPTADIIRELESALDWNRLVECHCHGPRCEKAPSESGPLDKWDRAARWQRAFAVARARLQGLALWWRGSGGASGQLTLPGDGLHSFDPLAPAPGRGTQRDPAGRASNRPSAPQKVGRRKTSMGGNRK